MALEMDLSDPDTLAKVRRSLAWSGEVKADVGVSCGTATILNEGIDKVGIRLAVRPSWRKGKVWDLPRTLRFSFVTDVAGTLGRTDDGRAWRLGTDGDGKLVQALMDDVVTDVVRECWEKARDFVRDHGPAALAFSGYLAAVEIASAMREERDLAARLDASTAERKVATRLLASVLAEGPKDPDSAAVAAPPSP